MTFKINFKAGKPARAVNENIHDDAAWGFAHELAATQSPVDQWPRQYAVHYIYEFTNRPWLSSRECVADMVAWILNHQSPESIKL